MDEGDVRNGMSRAFPFSAFVGGELAKKALMCALASPDVRSVLVCGPKGTGKSVLVRSAARVCGGRRLVTVPLNATDDRLFGGMNLEKTLSEGRAEASGGLVAESDGNILVVEDANLLDPARLSQIMNAVESGCMAVEREGVSAEVRCDTTLLATMDPEAGALPDHVLDRFDVCVMTSNLEDEGLRGEVVRRRLLFESDPDSLCSEFAEADAEVSERIGAAGRKARFALVPEGYCRAISEICTRLNISGHRGDVAVMNVSRALAALDGRGTADMDDLKEAATMCLEHRRNDSPEDDERPDQEQQPNQSPPEDGESQEDEDREDGEPDRPDPPDPRDSPPDAEEQDRPDDSDAPFPPPPPDGAEDEQVFSIGDVYEVIDYMSMQPGERPRGRTGRREGANSDDVRGRRVGYRVPSGRITDVALVASIRAAAPYQIYRDHSELAIVLEKPDLRESVREVRRGCNILFLVDGSGSIGAQRRMVAVKGAIMSMLTDAYQKRDTIGMAVFRANGAEEILPLTRSIDRAHRLLADIPTGGRTPLTHGLLKGMEILCRNRSDASERCMVILSDGRCNVSHSGGTPVDEMLDVARGISDSGVRFIVVDTECGRLRFGLALDLCAALGGTYLRLEELEAGNVERSVRMAMEEPRCTRFTAMCQRTPGRPSTSSTSA